MKEEEKKLFIVWAGNLEFGLIARVKEIIKKKYPLCNIYIRNADAYSGPTELEKCDGMFIQSGYQRLIDNAGAAGIEIIEIGKLLGGENENKGTVSGRGEGDGPSANDLLHTPKTGSTDPDKGSDATIQIDSADNRVGTKAPISKPGRPRKTRSAAKGGAQK